MLKSLREAVIPDNLSCEFILVDNNSGGDKRFVFEEIEGYCDSRIRYVFEEKRGISHARNRGINAAKGEIIAFTDDDVIVDKYWIQNIENAFKEHSDVACIGGKLLPIWEVSKPKWLKPDLYVYLALLDYGDSVTYMDLPNIWGANFAVKSEMFKKYGLFDSNLGRIPRKLYGYEETEFLQRLKNAGEKYCIILCQSFITVFPPIRCQKNTFANGGLIKASSEEFFLKTPSTTICLRLAPLQV
jgi:GT2 family glycosyltransferase